MSPQKGWAVGGLKKSYGGGGSSGPRGRVFPKVVGSLKKEVKKESTGRTPDEGARNPGGMENQTGGKKN